MRIKILFLVKDYRRFKKDWVYPHASLRIFQLKKKFIIEIIKIKKMKN